MLTRLALLVLGILVLAALALGAWEAWQIARLNRSLASLSGSLASLTDGLAQVASSTASSTANLQADLSASAQQEAAALKSQGDELQIAVARVELAVVSVVERSSIGATLASGTGFFIRANGYLITNKHVVDDPSGSYVAVLANGKEEPVTVVWMAPSEDLALLKIPGSGYPTVTLGSASTLVAGETVFAVGNALGRFENTVSVGVVSGLNRSITATDPTTDLPESLSGVIQTDAAINPGNSGGPLADLSGQVVGVGVATAQGAQSIGFALPVSEVKNAIASLGI